MIKASMSEESASPSFVNEVEGVKPPLSPAKGGEGHVTNLSRRSTAGRSHLTISRTSSPGVTGNGDEPPYWAITRESGCVPALIVALKFAPDGEPIWWGGRFPQPLEAYEDLLDDLPKVLAQSGELDKRIEMLPPLDLYASNLQKSQILGEIIKSTGQGHSDSCTASVRLDLEYRQGFVCRGHVQRERAFAIFAFLANAFVFSRRNPPSNAPIILPAKISVPLKRLSVSVGRRPITDYACSVLNNWILKDPHGDFTLENIHVPRTFTGLEAEEWFFAIHAVIEHRGGLALINMKRARGEIEEFFIQRKLHLGEDREASKRAVALQRLLGHSKQFSVGAAPSSGTSSPSSEHAAAKRTTFDDLTTEKAQAVCQYLEEIEKSLEGIYETMKRLPERCPPEVFYFKIRQWVSSWPDSGVIYETYCNCGFDESKSLMTPEKFSGASGAQSSLLPSIDGFLGIAYGHKQNVEATPIEARTDLGAFIRQLKSFRFSMPVVHRELVERFESHGSLNEFIAALEEHYLKMSTSQSSSIDREKVALLQQTLADVKIRYNACIQQLTLFRKTHMDFAVRFIKGMAPKRPDAPAQASIKGTGGSDFAKHLNQHITDTKRSLYEVAGGHSQANVVTPSLSLGGSSAGGGSVTPKFSLLPTNSEKLEVKPFAIDTSKEE